MHTPRSDALLREKPSSKVWVTGGKGGLPVAGATIITKRTTPIKYPLSPNHALKRGGGLRIDPRRRLCKERNGPALPPFSHPPQLLRLNVDHSIKRFTRATLSCRGNFPPLLHHFFGCYPPSMASRESRASNLSVSSNSVNRKRKGEILSFRILSSPSLF